ncbi:hypothetical protein [Pseudomonas huanghezhanensis]|nr:hypothetical protein [Pseudomonas sp. BSw22131]
MNATEKSSQAQAAGIFFDRNLGFLVRSAAFGILMLPGALGMLILPEGL